MDSTSSLKHVVVTGGSRGIGRATVLAFARDGAAVSSCYAHQSAASDSLGLELADTDAPHLLAKADVSEESDMRAFLSQSHE
jgi:3-oxoacyl-[acyl-carrier protein] reductase